MHTVIHKHCFCFMVFFLEHLLRIHSIMLPKSHDCMAVTNRIKTTPRCPSIVAVSTSSVSLSFGDALDNVFGRESSAYHVFVTFQFALRNNVDFS